MFLGVSGNVSPVEMSEVERKNFAKWLLGLQKRHFDDNAKAAYTYAKVNSATWTRATTAQRLKPMSISKIVRAFREDAEGDWTRLGLDRGPATVGTPTQDQPGYVSGPGGKVEGGASDSEVLRAIRQMQEDVRAVSERLARLEQERDA